MPKERAREDRLCLLTPVKDEERETGEQIIRKLLENGWYVFGEATQFHKLLKPGDWICFYWSTVGVVAQAEVASTPERKKLPQVTYPDLFPWAFKVRSVRFFFDRPIVVDADVRDRLDAFKGKNPDAPWAWLVRSTRRLSEHDFRALTGDID
jgi:hypothetical protein